MPNPFAINLHLDAKERARSPKKIVPASFLGGFAGRWALVVHYNRCGSITMQKL